jgi:hypothetical protein
MSIIATHNSQQENVNTQTHNVPLSVPPAKMANLPTETAPIPFRATLSSAVDHFPVALSNTSVALKLISSDMHMRRAGQALRLELNTGPRAHQHSHANHLKIVVAFHSPESPILLLPPANMAMFPTDAVEAPKRATLSCAVVHTPSLSWAKAARIAEAVTATASSQLNKRMPSESTQRNLSPGVRAEIQKTIRTRMKM